MRSASAVTIVCFHGINKQGEEWGSFARVEYAPGFCNIEQIAKQIVERYDFTEVRVRYSTQHERDAFLMPAIENELPLFQIPMRSIH